MVVYNKQLNAIKLTLAPKIPMKPVYAPEIATVNDKFHAKCACGSERVYTTKNTALKMLKRGACQACRPSHTYHERGTPEGLFQNLAGKWACYCSGCGKEQAYTRKDHAKQSLLNDWQCKKCVGFVKGLYSNLPKGHEVRLYNKFSKMAKQRGIEWHLTQEQMFQAYSGRCNMTGWPIDITYEAPTASLDRIDSSAAYTVNNIQWVHSMVNMSKNKYDLNVFISMCVAIAKKQASSYEHNNNTTA